MKNRNIHNLCFIWSLVLITYSCTTCNIRKNYDAIKYKRLSDLHLVYNYSDFEYEYLEDVPTSKPIKIFGITNDGSRGRYKHIADYKLKNKEKYNGKAVRFHRNGILRKLDGFTIYAFSKGILKYKYTLELVNDTSFIPAEKMIHNQTNWINYQFRNKLYRLSELEIPDSLEISIKKYENGDSFFRVCDFNDLYYELEVDNNGDTIKFVYESDSLEVELYRNVKYSSIEVDFLGKYFYESHEAWDTNIGYYYTKTNQKKVVTTLANDTIEITDYPSNENIGKIIRFSLKGDTIEIINLSSFNGNIVPHGDALKLNVKGDTISFKSYKEGRLTKW